MADKDSKTSPDRSNSNRVDRNRDKSRDRPKPYSTNRSQGGGTKGAPFNRVFLSNIPFEEKWQAIKDMLREKIGEVTYVELFTDMSGRSRGYGVVEFPSRELAEKCVEKMNKFSINNRQLVVKPDYHGDLVKRVLMRDGPPPNSPRYSNIFAGEGFGMPPMPNMPPPMPFPSPMPGMGRSLPNPPPMSGGGRNGNFMPGPGPIGNTVFVANLDYKATYSKLKEVFGLAGNVSKVDLRLDNNNKSRGMATVTFETNMEAMQAISMFNNQKLYDRVMVVRMDKENAKKEDVLPSGLHSIGPALPIGSLGDMAGYSSNGSSSFNSSSLQGLSGASSSSGVSGLDLSSLGSRSGGRMGEGLSSSMGMGSGRTGVGLSDLTARYGNLTARGDMNLDESARLLAAATSLGLSEKERLDLDIARVDDRIRDINRSLAAAETFGSNNRAVESPFVRGGVAAGGRKEENTNNVVFVRNLPFSVSWQDLRTEFSKVGRVMFAQIKTDNGKSKGYGTVRFESPDQALLAVKFFDGMEYEGRKIDVKLNETNYY